MSRLGQRLHPDDRVRGPVIAVHRDPGLGYLGQVLGLEGDDIDRDPGDLLGCRSRGGQRAAEVGERLAGLAREVTGRDRFPSASSATWPETNAIRLPVATTTCV